MNGKPLLITILLLLPGAAGAQGVPSDKAAQDLFQFYHQNYFQSVGRMQELDLFQDGTVLHGFINLHGTSSTIRSDTLDLARELAGTVSFFFQIPPDYQWTVLEGGFFERKAIETIDTWKNVIMMLTIDGVPFEDAGYVKIMVDEQGRLRTLVVNVPRLRPEIVATVRNTPVTPASAQTRIQNDANTLAPGNIFNIQPNTSVKFTNFRKLAIAQEPYVIYRTVVNRASYAVNGRTGAVSRVSTMR